MEPRTSRKDYKNHQYSGARKSRKRVRGQMKRYHGEVKSRNEVWCKIRKLDVDGKKDDSQPNIFSSSIDEEVKKEPEGEIMEEGRKSPVELLSEVKEEPADSYEITYTTTEVQHRVNNENPQSVESVVESEVDVKIEPLEWKREEDKLLLELMKQSLADGKAKTIYSIVESQSEKFLQCCENRSLLDISKRLFHLLRVVNES